MADGTTFEKRGVPAASIVTAPFTRTADAMAKRHDFPGYRYATMPHPIGNLKPEQIRQRAREVLPQVLAILGLPAEAAK
ncbi:MAG TPA: hypothetical protein VII57_04720 [Dehalococcoidia bacterium]